MAAVALYYDPLFLGHDTLTHPENASRVEACLRLIDESGLGARLQRPECRDATFDELTAHPYARSRRTRTPRFGQRGPVMVLADTIANAGTYAAALRAAGAVVGATETVVRGDFDAAYCLVGRPATTPSPVAPMGFCFFNNVAIAARHAVAALGLQRVAIVDIDIHHGNGTQDAFYEDPSVLYVSTHQYPYYPGSGYWREAGGAPAPVRREPLAARRLRRRRVRACSSRSSRRSCAPYRPELMLVSAGYDAHYADPIDGAMMQLSCAGYASLIAALRDLRGAVQRRIVVALEGGYDLTALSWSVRNSIEALLGETPTPDPLGAAPAAASDLAS